MAIRSSLCMVLLAISAIAPVYGAGRDEVTLRPPAVPLVACDPYFSIWSCADRLTDDATRHWTGRPHRLTGMVRIDGKTYRIVGDAPADVAALEQKSLQVLPTRTIYEFEGGGVHVTLTFMTPALPEDLNVLSRPLTYVIWDVRATDGKEHDVQLYFSSSAELAVNVPEQKVAWSCPSTDKLLVVRMGSEEQPVLQKRGDDLRIDWGYLYTAASPENAIATVGSHEVCTQAFGDTGRLPRTDDVRMPRAANDGMPVAAFAFDLGRVRRRPVSRHLMLAYDDEYSINYFGQKLRPYWRRNGAEASDLLDVAAKDYRRLSNRCREFDGEMMKDLTAVGGPKYALLCALAYRQCFAASKFVADGNGQPMSFSKENFSNGCIATSDVFYPMAPQFLLFGPSLAKSFLVPFMNYAASDRWPFPFAPHDLGTYPHATGQVYGGGERSEENQMPVEESGNLLILMAAVAQMEGNADFAGLYWPQLTAWAEYLKDKGFDPENQLCTDDFAGHLAHNVNLSAKAICGLGSYAKLCAMRGDNAKADEYRALARQFAARWVEEADDGDHYRLAFDKPGTWSQKYNLVWDEILGLDLFPAEVLRKEMDHYKKVQNTYGLPLDNRSRYTKLDWILWTATLTGERKDFEALVDPVFRFLNETPDRVPMTDWYWTHDAKKRGFQARPVVGGVFLRTLYEKRMWRKWARRDVTDAAGWAPLPKPPKVVTVVPTSQDEPLMWRYTTEKPADGWFGEDFDASGWREGPGGFGTRGTPGASIGTVWRSSDIWLRREFVLPEGTWHDLHLQIHHDEDAEVYVNGVLVLATSGFTASYSQLPMKPAGRAALRPGKNVFAVHCRQTTGGQYIDVGLADVIRQDARTP